MPEIKLEHVTKRWKDFYAVDDLSLCIEDNAFVTLLGPSGCGKTTVLRMIAGLETPTSGRITIGDRVVFDSALGINVPASRRKVGFLFQNYALWPNMTVYENIAFGLSNVKEPMVKVDFEAKNAARLAEILREPEELWRLTEDCRDKKGKLDEKKALLRLIDAYAISQYTAKRLLSLRVEAGRDVSAAAAALEKQAEEAIRSRGLNADFEYLRDGQRVMETRKLTREEIDLTVRRVSRIVKIGMFTDRYPAELSGGQQQRVAIARTLAPEPTVLFMDEPLSNLDAKLRLEMRYELQRLHLETGSTFVYVTHDQMEAMTLATKICLLRNGALQQYEAPLEVYARPANLFAADFVGNPPVNFIEAKGTQASPNGEVELRVFDGVPAWFRASEDLDLGQWFRDRDARAASEAEAARRAAGQKGYVEKGNRDEPFRCRFERVTEEDDTLREPPEYRDGDLILGVRPEFLEITPEGPLEGEIYGAMPSGMESTVKLRFGGFLLTGVVFGSALFPLGEKVRFRFSGNGILLFDRKSGRRIALGSLRF